MKFSSLLKTVAGAVAASLMIVTAQPVEANPVPTPLTEALEIVEKQAATILSDNGVAPLDKTTVEERLAAADAYFADIKDNGNTLVLGKGHFQKRGNNLIILGESGKTLAEFPLIAVLGERMVDVAVTLKDDGQAATFSALPQTERALSLEVQQARAGIMGPNTRLRDFYRAWGKYLNRMEVENFQAVVASGVMGGLAGIGAGIAVGVLTGAIIFFGFGLLNLIPLVPLISLGLAVGIGAMVGLISSLLFIAPGAVLGTILLGFTSEDPKTREAAGEALAAGLALVYLWWLPPSATGGGPGSGVGKTNPEN